MGAKEIKDRLRALASSKKPHYIFMGQTPLDSAIGYDYSDENFARLVIPSTGRTAIQNAKIRLQDLTKPMQFTIPYDHISCIVEPEIESDVIATVPEKILRRIVNEHEDSAVDCLSIE